MWFLVKILISLIAFVIRFYGKHFQRQSEFDRESDGLKYLVKEHRNKSNVTGTDIKIPFECASVFKITKEGQLDRFFKSLGLTEEFQTGDAKFDETFYLASDCSKFRAEVKLDASARALIAELFSRGSKYIFCDGYTLTVHFEGKLAEREAGAIESSIKLFKQISDLGKLQLCYSVLLRPVCYCY